MKREGEKRTILNNKRGQITIFIIIAVIIVVAGVLVYLFYPQISSTLGGEQDANAFISNCIEDEIQDNVEIISSQGGILEPAPYILYEDEKIQYLCYTEEYYKTCVVQKPLLKRQIEREIKNGIEGEVKNCFNELKTNFENRGYEVTVREGEVGVELLPERIVSTFNYTVALTRTETQRYESFNVVLNNNLYELISIANSIIDLESEYGDSDKDLYMDLYHELDIQKRTPEYGTTLYILTDTPTGNKFQFASRSVVMPPGYGYDIV